MKKDKQLKEKDLIKNIDKNNLTRDEWADKINKMLDKT